MRIFYIIILSLTVAGCATRSPYLKTQAAFQQDIQNIGEKTVLEIGPRLRVKTVIIDPGHGGRDIGARSKKFGIREKDITLKIARRLKGILEANGIDAVLTRGSDRFISLEDRCVIANEKHSDIFISIHANASRRGRVKGFECFYLTGAIDDNERAANAAMDEPCRIEGASRAGRSKELEITLWDMVLAENRLESQELARRILAAVKEDLPMKDRGMKPARFHVLRETRMPSVLVEVGFLTNRLDAAKMKAPDYVDRISQVLADGILAFKGEFERTNGFTT